MNTFPHASVALNINSKISEAAGKREDKKYIQVSFSLFGLRLKLWVANNQKLSHVSPQQLKSCWLALGKNVDQKYSFGKETTGEKRVNSTDLRALLFQVVGWGKLSEGGLPANVLQVSQNLLCRLITIDPILTCCVLQDNSILTTMASFDLWVSRRCRCQ